MPSPTTTGHALLSLIALRPNWSTYELAGQVARNLRFLWPRAESRVYDEARTLVRKGLVHSRHAGTGRRPRTVYTISEAGQQELDSWLATPSGSIRLQSDGLLRILVGRLATTTQLLNAVDQIRQDADTLFAQGRLTGEEYLAGTAPVPGRRRLPRARVRLLVPLRPHAARLGQPHRNRHHRLGRPATRHRSRHRTHPRTRRPTAAHHRPHP